MRARHLLQSRSSAALTGGASKGGWRTAEEWGASAAARMAAAAAARMAAAAAMRVGKRPEVGLRHCQRLGPPKTLATGRR